MHKINKEIFELTVGSKEEGIRIEGELNNILSNGMNDALNKMMDEISSTGENLILDRIELDLGVMDEREFSSEFKSRFQEKLEIVLRDANSNALVKQGLRTKLLSSEARKRKSVLYDQYDTARDSKEIKLLQNSDYFFSIFVFFLEHGYMPWWSPDISLKDLETQLVKTIDKLHTDELISLLSENEGMLKRFIYQFEEKIIFQLLSKSDLFPSNYIENIYKELTELVYTLFEPIILKEKFRKDLLAKIILNKKIFGSTQFLEQIFEELLSGISLATGIKPKELVFSVYLYILSKKIMDVSLYISETITSYLRDIHFSKTELMKSTYLRSIIYKLFIKPQLYAKEEINEIIRRDYLSQSLTIRSTAIQEIIFSVVREIYMRSILNDTRTIGEKQGKKRILQQNLLKMGIDYLSDGMKELKNVKIGEETIYQMVEELLHEMTIRLTALKQDGDALNDVIFVEYRQLILKIKMLFNDEERFMKYLSELNDLLEIKIVEKGGTIEILSALKKAFEKVSQYGSEYLNLFTYPKYIEPGKKNEKSEFREIGIDMDSELSEEYYIDNAGLVILAPFIATLFNRVRYLDENKEFLQGQAERAVYLLQSLVSENYKIEENRLILNKVICGLPLNYPIMKNIELNTVELEEIPKLLESAISNWPRIGNTSITGFRESFLLRMGKLVNDDAYWKLIVERKPFDILLDSIPWSFTTIDLPWMHKPMKVEW